MCGLFGAIGRKINHHILRHLATLNESRGRQSMGLFASDGDGWKMAGSPTDCLKDETFARFFRDKAKACWAICGHTRQPTGGSAVTTAHAHPFQYGEVVGSHNGMIDAPKEYGVDSMYAIDLLSKHPAGEFQAALGGVTGWYVLTFLDKRNGKVYLLNWRGDLAFNKVNGVVYYSSAKDHLLVATGKPADTVTQSGEVWSFDGDKGVKEPAFTGKEFTSTRLTVQHYQEYHRPYYNYSGESYIYGGTKETLYYNLKKKAGRERFFEACTGDFRVNNSKKIVEIETKEWSTTPSKWIELPPEVADEFFQLEKTAKYLDAYTPEAGAQGAAEADTQEIGADVIEQARIFAAEAEARDNAENIRAREQAQAVDDLIEDLRDDGTTVSTPSQIKRRMRNRRRLELQEDGYSPSAMGEILVREGLM